MAKINLSPYTIEIRQKRNKENEDLFNLFGTGTSLFDVVKEIIDKYKQTPFKQSKNQKTLKFDDKVKFNNLSRIQLVQDTLYYGEYGVLMRLMDTNTGLMDSNPIDPDKSPVLEFAFTYFQDSLIKKHGYFILQTYSNKGYKTVLNRLLENELNAKFNKDVIIEMNPIISSDIIDLVKKGGRIFDITFISHDVSKDSTNDLLKDSSNQGLNIGHTKQFSMSITSSKGSNLVLPNQIEQFTEYLKKMILNSAEIPFYEMTKSRLDEIKIKIATINKDYTITIDENELEFKEIRPLDDTDVILENGAIASIYILNESMKYASEISKMYSEL